MYLRNTAVIMFSLDTGYRFNHWLYYKNINQTHQNNMEIVTKFILKSKYQSLKDEIKNKSIHCFTLYEINISNIIDIKGQNKEYGHWSKNIKEVVEQFGKNKMTFH